MKVTPRLRAIVPTAAIALAAVFLLAPAASAATQVPPLSSTPQYEALVDYVADLRERRDKPASGNEKAGFERQLTNRHRAAVNKAGALFRRAKAAAKAETQRRFQSASRKIRLAEAAELAELRARYSDKLNDAKVSSQRSVDAIEDRFDDRYETIRRQIRKLRKEKAKAKSLAAKDRVQGQINVLIEQVSNSRKQERAAIDKVNVRYGNQRRAIQAARIAATTQVRESRQEAVESLRQRWNRSYESRLADLRNRRANQLAELQTKLDAGRAYIASMPVGG